jgi:hypothetical protein
VGFWELTSEAGWIRWRTGRLPVTPLDRVADGGWVKISGRLDACEHPLAGPISGRACAAWSVRVRDWPRRVTVAVEQQAREFVIRDGSNRAALVHATGATVVLEMDTSSWPAEASEPILALLRRHGLSGDGYFGSPLSYRPYRYFEGALEIGEMITVVGVARLDVDPAGASGSYREPPMRVALTAAPKAPLWILGGAA